MKKHRADRIELILFMILLSWVTGCAGTSEPVKFYRLTPAVSAENDGNAENYEESIRIGLGPIEFPEYLNRPQLVLDSGGNKLIISEFHRWAEPLRKNFSAALVENLEVLLFSQSVFEYPWPPSVEIDYRIALQVVRFEGSDQGDVELITRWMVLDGGTQNLERTGRTKIIESASAPRDFDALVAAQSRAVGTLSREIAREIRSLSLSGMDAQ